MKLVKPLHCVVLRLRWENSRMEVSHTDGGYNLRVNQNKIEDIGLPALNEVYSTLSPKHNRKTLSDENLLDILMTEW